MRRELLPLLRDLDPRIVDHLAATIGARQVGSPGAAAAALYVQERAEAIAEAARAAGLEARVTVSRVSGSFAGNFLTFRFDTVYADVPNVLLTLRPAHAHRRNASAVLLAAHYDSPLGSPGAADAAACVAACIA